MVRNEMYIGSLERRKLSLYLCDDLEFAICLDLKLRDLSGQDVRDTSSVVYLVDMCEP